MTAAVLFLAVSAFIAPVLAQNGCTWTLISTEQSITSANYPDNYDRLFCKCHCVRWNIKAPNDKIVRLTIEDFELHKKDKLIIYDNQKPKNADIIFIANGKDTPAANESYATSSNFAFVKFMPKRGNKRGFSLKIEFVESGPPPSTNDPCSEEGASFSGSTSINFPEGANGVYSSNQDCRWSVVNDDDSAEIIRIRFNRLDIEDHETCSWDKVQIYNSDTESQDNFMGDVCGEGIPDDVYLEGNGVFFKFASDDYINGGGFSVDVDFITRATAESENAQCIGNVHELVNSGTITSPILGLRNYMNHMSCQYRITVGAGKFVKLTFDKFMLEEESSDSSLCYDSVSVFDGVDANANTLGVYCGQNNPSVLWSETSNTVFIEFGTDSYAVGGGFQISFEASDTNIPPTTIAPPPYSGTCGKRPVTSSATKIVGGQEAESNSWPWMISLGSGRYSHFCGGSIISAEWVITAAHCVDGSSANNLKVKVGDHQLYDDTSIDVMHNVAEVIMHPQYDSSKTNKDIALLRLSTDISFSDKVSPVCLPDEPPHVDKDAAVTGWGTMSEGGASSDILREVFVPIVSNEYCNIKYNGKITQYMMCAALTGGGKDACQGDSGGPLVTLKGEDTYVLNGLTSWGHGCARPNKPGVYTDVYSLIDWVTQHTGFTGGNGGSTTLSPPVSPDSSTSSPESSQTPVPSTAAPPVSGTCGIPSITPIGPVNAATAIRIVGGVEAIANSWPWQISMQIKSSDFHFCGGSIIAAKWVITAAHCVQGQNKNGIQIVAGEHNFYQNNGREQVLNVQRILMHAGYNSGTMDNDIALIELTTDIVFNQYVSPVCLAQTAPENSMNCATTGWGTLSSGGSSPDELYQVYVPLLTTETCRTSSVYGNAITDNMVCAGLSDGGKDSCQGDSGGPLVYKDNNGEFVLHGLTSWGYGCAAAGSPGVYTKVFNYYSWITQYIGQ